MWGHMDTYGWGWGWAGMGIGMILYWALLIAAIVALVRYTAGSNRSSGHLHPRERTALDLLKDRYARGEIEREEFLQKKRDLEG